MKKNLPILTGLRFFAALYVFIFHINLTQPVDFLGTFIYSFIKQGAGGVNVFFILSGFILFYNYYGKQINFSEFILKRLAKIYPVYLAGFFICLIIVKVMQIEIKDFFEIQVMNLLMVQSYLPKFAQVWYGGGSWSISTEFFFYLCFPLLLHLISNLSKKKAILVFFLCLLCSIMPGILYNLKLVPFALHYAFPPARIFEFASGMIVAMLVIKYRITLSIIIIYTVILCSFLFFLFVGRKLEGYVIQNIIIIPLTSIILIISTTPKKHILNFLRNKLFVYLGNISYSFYIIQIPILIILENIDHFNIYNRFVTIIILFCINILAAMILYHLIEKPFHKILTKRIKDIFNKNTETLI
ncbi:acyltransferase [Chryseobacterium sp. PBS4-4]|uniref:Acyltransferase n=1 Tax=Chryseobacterium edaphi TaxID=2976532 RepID=A0ABT2W997_9FLAO|nr:acyltransferase [Chryseobacterium edaphi]